MPNKYPTSSSTVHNRYLGAGGFKGVDFTSPPAFVSPDRFSDAKNVYKDYRSGLGACVETFPGYRNPFRFVQPDFEGYMPATIHGMVVWRVNGSGSLNGKTISNEDVVAIHAGTRLYIIPQRSVQGLAPDIESAEYSTGDVVCFPIKTENKEETYEELYKDFTFNMNGEEVASTVFCAVLPDEYKNFLNCVDFLPDEPCKMFYEDGDLYIISNHRDGEDVQFRSFETMYRVKMGEGRFTPTDGTIVDYLFSAEKVVATYQAKDAYGNVSLVTEGGYVPTLYINNEEYEQQNLLSPSYSELFTSITVERTAETGGGPSGDAAIDTWTCYPSSKACFTWSRSADGAEFDGASVAIYVDDTKVFDGYDPKGSGTHDRVTVEFFYRGTKIESLNAPDDAASGTVPFDEIRITDVIKNRKILCTGATVKIVFDRQPDTSDFAQTSGLSAIAVLGCRVVERHDGRIFFSGNPDYPNTVFYTHRDASTGANDITYVGASNYFKVGGGSAVTALVSTTSSLVIFKEATGADGDSEIYYATGVMTQNDLIPKIYTVTQGATNVDSATAAFTFCDDVCFASASGIFGLNKLQTNLERSVQSRSNLINGRFVTEDPNVLLTVWNGYLCVYCKSGHMYLADSRQLSSDGYEWYYVDGIGYYRTYPIYGVDNDAAGSDKKEAAEIYDESGDSIGTASACWVTIPITDTNIGYLHQTIYNENGDEETIKIKCRYVERVLDNGKTLYHILKNDIKRGRDASSFRPATTMITVGDSIWFGANGSLLVLNSDLRGVPNNDDDAGVDPTRIRNKWYSQNGVAYESYVTTYYDDAGAPNLAKSTISRSTVIDMKTIPGSAFKVSFYTARDGWQTPVQSTSSIPDYSDSDFSNVSFDADMHTVVTLRERTNRWSRKMYRIYSDENCRPFGIHRISYQFKVAGRIKD